ncbi:molybdopterin synthase catalytic subunit [Paraburkholderia sp. UCT70]
MRNANVGAVVSFIGLVRNSGEFDDVVALELERYPGMTEQPLWSIVEEAVARWKVDAVKVVHRIGRVALGHAVVVVVVVVAAPNRAAALKAREFVMDFLNVHTPFWKKEVRRDGSAEWVEARTRDEQAMMRRGLT